jgi:hypothetical protein
MRALIFVVKLLLLGAFFIVSNEDLALKDPGNFEDFSGLYYDWLGDLFNGGKTVTGYVIKVDWLPTLDSDPSFNPSGEG